MRASYTRKTVSYTHLDVYKRQPVYNAHIVDKLQAAGAVVIAKASMDELGMGGTNRNAYTCLLYTSQGHLSTSLCAVCILPDAAQQTLRKLSIRFIELWICMARV